MKIDCKIKQHETLNYTVFGQNIQSKTYTNGKNKKNNFLDNLQVI